MLLYQFIHLSEFILGVLENFHSIHPSGAYTHFFFNKAFVSWSVNLFFQREARSFFSFQKHVGFLVNQFIFIFFSFWQSWYLRSHTFFFEKSCERGYARPTYVKIQRQGNQRNAMISRKKQWQNKLKAIMSDHGGSKNNNWKQQC